MEWMERLAGNQNKRYSRRNFLSFEDAREVARAFGIKSVREWEDYARAAKLPNNIPSVPSKKYKDEGWNGWKDWLGY